MTACPCGLDGPCTDRQCRVRVYRCECCTAPFPSPEAAKRCAEIDERRG